MATRVEDERATKRELLHSVPAVRAGVELVEADGGLLTARYLSERGNGFFDMFRPPKTERRYELDAFGTFVLRRIDGRHTVLQIIDAFQQRFGMSRRECELGVVAFLKMLVHRRVINVITIPEA
jgi:hypothetical protein